MNFIDSFDDIKKNAYEKFDLYYNNFRTSINDEASTWKKENSEFED